jgi:epoxyqueuosine reductase
MLPRPELINPALEWLAAMDAAEFKRRFKGSPLERTGPKRLRRNIAIAMGNSGEEKFIPQLNAWAETGDPVLAEISLWAIQRIESLSTIGPELRAPADRSGQPNSPPALLASE